MGECHDDILIAGSQFNNQVGEGLFNFSSEAHLIVDELFRIVRVNAAAVRLFGHKEENFLSMPLVSILPDGSPKNFSYMQNRYGAENAVSPIGTHKTFTGIHKDGTELLVVATITTILHESRLFHVISCHKAVTSVDFSHADWFVNQRNQAIASLAPIGLFQLNNRWECVYVNDFWCRLSGLNCDESQKHGWLKAIHNLDHQRVTGEIMSALIAGRPYRCECRLLTPLGESRWVILLIRGMKSPDNSNLGFLGTVQDVDDLIKTKESLEKIAQFDVVTGLLNRQLFMDRLKQAIYRSSRTSSVALLFIDLDEFKSVNDTFGHEAGDFLLRICAKRLLEVVRKEDTVARLAGDEFVVIIERAESIEGAEVVARKIIAALASPVVIEGHEVLVPASIGISTTNDDNCSAEELLKQADTAMYRAKESGRNQYCVYNADLNREIDRRNKIRHLLGFALERKEVRLEYQPQIDIATGELIGHEALIRWNSDALGVIPPSVFVPILETSGLIHEYTRWTIVEALKWQSSPQFKESQIGKVISVNLSAKTFDDLSFSSFVKSCLKSFELMPGSLVFEVTETAVMNNPKRAVNVLRALRALRALRDLGVSVALDDFGIGYSSLTHLKKFPVNILKIDRSFVKGVASNSDDAIIVSSIIDLGKNMGMHTVAEGVETIEQLSFLREHCCDAYQGFLSQTMFNRNNVCYGRSQ